VFKRVAGECLRTRIVVHVVIGFGCDSGESAPAISDKGENRLVLVIVGFV
jgi:hypothetical protein